MDSKQTAWPVVALVAVALVCITVLGALGQASDALLQVIGSAVLPTVTVILYGARIEQGVTRVREQVNGTMSRIIDKLPEGSQIVDKLPSDHGGHA